MGQQISNQPKLSGEITLNRIRATCQRDDKMPKELKEFNVNLLANDLNTLGMEIPLVNNQGHAREADDICMDIKRVVYPDVEGACMMSNHREATRSIENMVKTFNKNYGARISLYADPIAKKGKRNLADVCDDLYLVLDKLHRKLNDQPLVIKKKLEEALSQLEERKRHITSRMLPVIANITEARQNDNTDKQIKAAEQIYNVTNGLLNQQLHSSYGLMKKTLDDFDVNTLEHVPGGITGSFGSNLFNAKNSLEHFNNTRYLQNRPITDVAKNLLAASVSTGLAINDCSKCMKRLGVIGTLPTVQQERYAQLYTHLAQAVKNAGSNQEVQELFKCFQILASDAGCTLPDATVFNEALTNFNSMNLGVYNPASQTYDMNTLNLIQKTVHAAKTGQPISAINIVSGTATNP